MEESYALPYYYYVSLQEKRSFDLPMARGEICRPCHRTILASYDGSIRALSCGNTPLRPQGIGRLAFLSSCISRPVRSRTCSASPYTRTHTPAAVLDVCCFFFHSFSCVSPTKGPIIALLVCICQCKANEERHRSVHVCVGGWALSVLAELYPKRLGV
jgi:hypothetical protein